MLARIQGHALGHKYWWNCAFGRPTPACLGIRWPALVSCCPAWVRIQPSVRVSTEHACDVGQCWLVADKYCSAFRLNPGRYGQIWIGFDKVLAGLVRLIVCVRMRSCRPLCQVKPLAAFEADLSASSVLDVFRIASGRLQSDQVRSKR